MYFVADTRYEKYDAFILITFFFTLRKLSRFFFFESRNNYLVYSATALRVLQRDSKKFFVIISR